jgi:N-acyl-D-aspartate/D-glutamate deacylase
VHIGSGDAGAHITQFAGAGDTCYLFETFVRERGDMTLERAVQRLTSELAAKWGLKDRGLLAAGQFADVVQFDPRTIARGEEVWVDDVPGGQGRYVRRPKGVERVIVNGDVLVEKGGYTENRPGRLI